jgi:hypothetical protein
MTPAALLASARSLIEGDPDAVGLIDRATISGPTFVDGGAVGDSVTFSTTATNVPCLHEPLGKQETFIVGGEAFVCSHRLHLIRSSITAGITPEHRITIAARNDTPQLIFENPVTDHESLSPLVTLHANLVKQGYQP